jgi:hypothetical protein
MLTTLLECLHTDSISRSSIWRILHDVDLKPHKKPNYSHLKWVFVLELLEAVRVTCYL